MATEGEIDVAVKEIQVENKENHEEIVTVELPAPNGWKKKFIPKTGGTPKKNEIVFISPTGEEIKAKRQLDLYLKAHPGGPPSSEFDWGTGDTPRRSARISEKSKATESPEHEPAKKRERKSSSKKGAKEVGNDVDHEAPKDEPAAVAVDESKASQDVEMKDTENGEDKTMDEATIGEDLPVQQDGADKESEAPVPLSVPNELEASAKKDTEVAVGSSENEGKLEDITSSEKEVKTGEVLLDDNSSPKEIQAEPKPIETNSVNCEEAQKAPPVSC